MGGVMGWNRSTMRRGTNGIWQQGMDEA
jgi:hypothetical protein